MADDVAKFTIDGQVHELDLSKLSLKEADQCEQLTGWTWMEWLKALLEDESRPPRAIAFLLWLSLSRAGEAPRFSELDFNVFSFEWIGDDDETNGEAAAAADDAGRPTGPEPASMMEIESPPATV